MIDWNSVGAAVAAAIVGGEAARRWVVKPLAEVLERSRHHDEDWYGMTPRPGVPGRPGVMARLGTLEDLATDTRDRMGTLETAREAAHTEALEMWAAIKAVAKARPPGHQ